MSDKYTSITSLSFLLRMYNVLNSEGNLMSVFEAKKILKDEGIILELYRPSMISGGEVRSFGVLSAKGLKYGNNDKNPLHPLETKISWKLNMFEEIANILKEG